MKEIHAMILIQPGNPNAAEEIIPVDEEVPTEGIDCELQPELCEENIVEIPNIPLEETEEEELPEEEELTETTEIEEIEKRKKDGRAKAVKIQAEAKTKAVKIQAEIRKGPPNKETTLFIFSSFIFY